MFCRVEMMFCRLDIRIERRSDEAYPGCTHRSERRARFLDTVTSSDLIDLRTQGAVPSVRRPETPTRLALVDVTGERKVAWLIAYGGADRSALATRG
jgi:hypothetical protein